MTVLDAVWTASYERLRVRRIELLVKSGLSPADAEAREQKEQTAFDAAVDRLKVAR